MNGNMQTVLDLCLERCERKDLRHAATACPKSSLDKATNYGAVQLGASNVIKVDIITPHDQPTGLRKSNHAQTRLQRSMKAQEMLESA